MPVAMCAGRTNGRSHRVVLEFLPPPEVYPGAGRDVNAKGRKKTNAPYKSTYNCADIAKS